MKKILGISGARPNFMKIDPVLRALEQTPERFSTVLVHTGQHYDQKMSRVFFDDLELRKPDFDLGVGSGSHAEQTARIMIGIEQVLLDEQPDLVIVVGDVNSTLAATITAAKLHIPVAHVEAGLRSFDRKMPEEINRLVTDTLSSYLFTTSRDADQNLLREGVPREQIFFVGNVMIDTLLRCRARAERSPILEKLRVSDPYALLTLHRPSNVDDAEVLGEILSALEKLQRELTIVFPVHPRTTKQLQTFGFDARLERMKNLRQVEPLGYLDFLALQIHAKLVLTDSGGVQEETTVLGVPCLTLRETTERPVTVSSGTNQITGPSRDKVVAAATAILNGQGIRGRVPELWDGRAAERIAAILSEELG